MTIKKYAYLHAYIKYMYTTMYMYMDVVYMPACFSGNFSFLLGYMYMHVQLGHLHSWTVQYLV